MIVRLLDVYGLFVFEYTDIGVCQLKRAFSGGLPNVCGDRQGGKAVKVSP